MYNIYLFGKMQQFSIDYLKAQLSAPSLEEESGIEEGGVVRQEIASYSGMASC